MRTALFMAAMTISEGLLAIARSNDLVISKAPSDVINFLGCLFIAFVVADVIELIHKISK